MLPAHPLPPPLTREMSPIPSPPPPPLPDTSPPHSPQLPLPPPAHNLLNQAPLSPSSSGDEEEIEDESDESYFYSDDDSDAKAENADIRRHKLSTANCYEVNASPHLSGNEDNDEVSRKSQSPREILIHSSRRGSAVREDRSSRRGSATREDKSNGRGTAARIKKKKKRGEPRVSKYNEYKKTVRQQIKPGTVEDLATLFTGWNQESEENVALSGSPPNQNEYNALGEKSQFKDKMDFIAASKVIQERLILSKNNSLYRPSVTMSDHDSNSKVITNENKAGDLKVEVELLDSTQVNNGLDYETSGGVTKANTKSSQTFEDEEEHGRGGETELERTNMTNGLQTNNEHGQHGSKQKYLRGNNQGPLNLIMSKESRPASKGIGVSKTSTVDKPHNWESERQKDIKNGMASPQSRYEPIPIDKITLSEITRASNSHTSPHSSSTTGYGNDLKLSKHSHAINNDTLLLSNDDPIKTRLDVVDSKHDSHYSEYNNAVDQTDLDLKSQEISSESRNDFGMMGKVSEENGDGGNDISAVDSVSTSTAFVKDGDGHNVSKILDDTWITVDVPLHVNGFDTDDVIVDDKSSNSSVVSTPDVNGVSRPGDDTIVFSSSQTSSASKNYITTSLERENRETVTKPFKNTFVTAERLNQPEHSANVNMQLLKNLQSQTREGSRPDLFVHSSRVWSGMRSDDDDGDGGGGGGEGGRERGMMEAEKRDVVMTGDIQTNKRPVLLHSQTQPERKDHHNLDRGEGISTSVNSVTEKAGDDFLSLLDDIHIEKDSTTLFVKNRNSFNSKEKHFSSKVSESDDNNIEEVISVLSGKDDFMSANNNKTRVTSKLVEREVELSSAVIANSSGDNNNNLFGQSSKSNIEEEIQKLHQQLSPQSSFKDPNATAHQDININASSSSLSSSNTVSSQSDHGDSQLKGHRTKSKSTRETAFNVDFFTSSTEEERKEELEASRKYAVAGVTLEVDQNSTSNTVPPVSKNNDGEVSVLHRELGTDETDLQNQTSSSVLNEEIPEESSQTKAIITSRESFRSVRDLFESEKEENKDVTQRTPSFKNRRGSKHLERRSSDGSKKWRLSGNSWTVEDYLVDSVGVNTSESSGIIESNFRVVDSVLSKDNTSSSVTDSERKITQQQEEDESKMTAVVGKVSSFNINRRGGAPHQESPHISSNQNGSNNSDVYLIQDTSGDVYALQEVNTPQQQAAVHQYDADNYASFDTSSSSQQISYHQPVQQRDRPANLYVDGSGINDSKAREVISAYLSSTEPSQNNNVATQSQTYSTRDESFSSSSITNNPHSIVVHQGDDSGGIGGGSGGGCGGGGYIANNNINLFGHGFNNNNLLNNSTVTVDTQMDGRFDSSQTWSSGNHEPYTIGGGGESGYKSSLVVTNLNTPNQKVYSSYSNTPSVDTSLDSQYHNGGVHVMRGSNHHLQQQQPLTVNVNHGQGGVTPFRTTPVTVQTTTSAVVGEKVDMKIDFPIIEQPRVTTTAELAHSSSDEENRKHYVIKSVTPKKSSLKISRDNDNSLDSNSDLIYTKRESLTGDIIIGGNRKTVIDNRSNTDHTSKTYVVSNSGQNNGRGRSKTKVSGKVKHHSPERFFKNAQLSLRRDKHDSSDEESKKYRTVTRVVLDSDNVDNSYSRSGSESPQNRYRVVSNQSSMYQDNSFSEDDQYYEVDSRRSEFDTRGKRRRYKVINSSHNIIDSDNVRAHSSPKPYKSHSKSFEENYVTKLEHKTTPSHYKTLPASSKRHKTVIQLDLDNSGIKEKGRSESEFSAPSSRLYRTKSVDSLSNGLKVFQTNDSVDSRKMWRTGRARSVGSSSDDSSSDFEGSGPYNLTPTLINTSRQKRGNKTYVVKSTADDHQHHPSGWYKSTIDINEKYPERYDQNYVIQSTNASSSGNQSFSQQRSDISSSHATEKSVYYVREAVQQPSYTQIPIQASPDSGRGTEFYSSDGENESVKKKFERVERIYEVRTEPEMPEQYLNESVNADMRVLRGKILIQNRMDESSHFEDEFEENVNLFDNSFHLGKDNPLYASDSDLMAALQREEQQQEMSRHVTQDITYDQVDSMSHKYKTSAKAEITPRPKRKKNLSSMLLSKLANVDSKDIRQTINVEHHNEEIVGDINFIHADGKKSGSQNTSNFDSVTENVELTLQQGKAFVIIKVIAERIIPTDLEFNIWRKSQAIVTRQIEIDLLANDQRRRFYHHVMDTQGRPALEGGSGRGHMSDMGGHQERQLNSMETLKLFSQILDIADGQGEKDHTTMRTKQEMGQLPVSGADLLY